MYKSFRRFDSFFTLVEGIVSAIIGIIIGILIVLILGGH